MLSENIADHALLADDVESASEISVPVLAQVHALFAAGVESASVVAICGLLKSNFSKSFLLIYFSQRNVPFIH